MRFSEACTAQGCYPIAPLWVFEQQLEKREVGRFTIKNGGQRPELCRDL
jgi:hypothetical protein